MNWIKSLAVTGVALSLGAGMAAAAPLTTTITYQGVLENGGAPAAGVFDLRFQLADAAVLGFVLQTIEVGDVTVTDGLFTVSLTFDTAHFAGDQRWVAVAVRDGASVGAYTSLTPRQPLTAAPFSIYAMKPWLKNAGNSNIYYDLGRVGINTNSPLGALGIVAAGTALDVENTAVTGNVARFESSHGSHVGDAVLVTKTGGGRCLQLYVADGDTANGLYAVTYGPGRAGSFEAHDSNSTSTVSILKNNGPGLTVYGSVGSGDSPSLTAPVSIMGGDDAELATDGYMMLGDKAGLNMVLDNNEIMARSNGAAASLFLNNEGGDVVIAPQATTRVKILEISGADVAERFPCSEATEPGTVMELDPANAGQLRVSRESYNKRVAGVVSGANGLPAGAILGNLPGHEKYPAIAMSGRVWVKCDASQGAIAVGDLLTTSDTAGHAMKADDSARNHGAVLGKAMSALEPGKQGLVLVLVNLH